MSPLERIEDEMCWRTDSPGEFRTGNAGVELLVSLFIEGCELLRSHVLDSSAFELRRPLERHPGLIVIAVDA